MSETEKTEERTALEAEATALNINWRANWRDETLIEKIAEASAEAAQTAIAPGGEGEGEAAPSPSPAAEVEVAASAEAVAPAVALDTEATVLFEDEAEPMVRVRGPKLGRWRCGRNFGREVTEIPMSELSEKDLEALKSDPRLTVVVEE
jgi:hypothetical protein